MQPQLEISEVPGPIQQRARIEALDVARGVAVLGILLMNIWAFGGPQAFFDYPLAIAERGGAPVTTWAVMHTLFEGTQRALLSILFGAGALLTMRRFEGAAGPGSAKGIYYRRTVALIAFGLVNAYVFLWPADILFVYGLAALCLYPLRRLRTRYLLVIVLAALAVPAIMRAAEITRLQALERASEQARAVAESGAPAGDAARQSIEDWQRVMRKARPSAADEEIAADVRTLQQGTFREIFLHQAGVSVILQTIVAVKWWFLDALAGMLLGMALCRSGVLTLPSPSRRYWLMLGAGFAVGLPLAFWQTTTLLATAFHPTQVEITKLGYDLRRLAMALGYLGLILLVCHHGAAHALRSSLAAVGRMALTNYLAQSLLCAFIFYGFGLGLYGRLTGYELYAVVALVWAMEFAWSGWWLRRFRIGPFEWVWRSLTYRRMQAWREIPAPSHG